MVKYKITWTRRANRGPRAAGRLAGLPLAVIAASLLGCENFNWHTVPPEPAPPPKSAAAEDAPWSGTVGAESIVTNVDVQPLRGFGLVVGLDGRGSSDCPTVIRDYLVELLSKELGPKAPSERRKIPSASELIDSLDTAVVEVTGVVAAGARKGTRFDLEIRALPGTSTQSLEGGLLLATPMRYFDQAASGQGLIAGAVLAEGAGPVFVNPLAEPDASSETDPRHGFVLGGGRALDERPFKLTLVRPNYQLAQRIERRVNECFGHRPKAAEALSAGFLELHTPPALGRQPQRFVALVSQLYLDNRPAQLEPKLRELARQAVAGGANLERTAVAWEGLGRSVTPHLQPFYTNPDASVSFYAGRAGLRVGDLSALSILGAAAATPEHPHRLAAIRELGNCESPQTALLLAPLLSAPDDNVRVAAYEALLLRGHPAVQPITFPHRLDQSQINFVLDVVESSGPPLIYVRRTRLARIAVFGDRIRLTPPIFYTDPDDSVTIHTVDGSDDLQLFAKRGGRMSEQLVLPPRVVDLLTSLADLPVRDEAGRLRGIGLPYSQVIGILNALTADETIPARLVMERGGPAVPSAPEGAPERPEGDRPETG